jgi:diguanylate cyclase (GGDEF)-like protein/PAS domain S-box-containing protein
MLIEVRKPQNASAMLETPACSCAAMAVQSPWRSLLDHASDGILSASPDGAVLYANAAACRMLGRDLTETVGATLGQLIAPVGAGALDFCADGEERRAEGLHARGHRIPMSIKVSLADQGEPAESAWRIVVMKDVRKQDATQSAIAHALRQLSETDELRRVIVHNAPCAIFVLSKHGIIESVNPAGEQLLGHKAQQLVGRCTMQGFFDADQVQERARLLALRLNHDEPELDVLKHLTLSSPDQPTEWHMLRADGGTLIAEVRVTELRNEQGDCTGHIAMAHNVTSRRDAENQLQHMALHDSLTALPNRNMLQDQLKACMGIAEREGHTMAMMFLDLDRFKKINDSLGHHIGDHVLIEVARRLRSSMRTSDIVARLGGDEFVVLLPRITEHGDGQRVANKVLEAFSEPLRIGPHELRVTPSIGLALYPDHGQDPITLMRHADLAMYQAKSEGRNRVQVYSEKMLAPTAETLVLENDLYKALERDELRLHFQPQFDCASGRITGAEALLRWQHDGKLVPPIDFIPLAEETGLIVPMGEWVLRRACTMAQQWRAQTGWPLRIAVNLSAVQLDQAGIVGTVARALCDTGLPATALELEITESVIVRESLRAADVLRQLRALGVGIAIDDFGVGYSSFAYLRELPVDRFKLDRSFLCAVPGSSGDSRLVAALIAMGHRLEVGIVAEGVENAEQAAFLKAHGCDEAQGFHLGRPITEAAFGELLAAHSLAHTAQIRG